MDGSRANLKGQLIMGASSLQQEYQKSVLQRGLKISQKGAPDLFQLGEEGATEAP